MSIARKTLPNLGQKSLISPKFYVTFDQLLKIRLCTYKQVSSIANTFVENNARAHTHTHTHTYIYIYIYNSTYSIAHIQIFPKRQKIAECYHVECKIIQ